MQSDQRGNGRLRLQISWALAALWLISFLASSFWARSGAGAALYGIQQLLLLVLLCVHGSAFYGWGGVAAFLAIGSLVGFVFEATSIATGFPFGAYTHNLPGPRLFGVTLAAALIYPVTGWFAWAVTRVLLLERPDRNLGFGRFIAPLLGGFVLAGFDFPYDPIGASIANLWTYAHPRGQFGVPLTNFLGWILTGWVLFQVFAVIEHRLPATSVSRSRAYWALPCVVWVAFALQYPIYLAIHPGGEVRLGSRTFIVADIYEASLCASLFTLIFTGLLGLCRLSLSPASWSAGATSSGAVLGVGGNLVEASVVVGDDAGPGNSAGSL